LAIRDQTPFVHEMLQAMLERTPSDFSFEFIPDLPDADSFGMSGYDSLNGL
jgi:hypothetical protein